MSMEPTRWVRMDFGSGTEEDVQRSGEWHLQDGEAETPVTLCGVDFHMIPVEAEDFQAPPPHACPECIEAQP